MGLFNNDAPYCEARAYCKSEGGKRLPLGDELANEKTAHPYIRARDIRDGKVTFDDPVYLTDNIFQKIKNYTVKVNDVCINIVGANVGDVGITPPFLDGANLTENAVKLTNLRNCDPFFLNYCLLGSEPQSQMKQYAAGAAQPKLGIYKINEIDIRLPPLETQRKIAAILSTYDDLIENNTRRIKILQEMAQALYREWFVNFRFPGHEQVKMVDSPLGMVPEGWEVKSLKDIVDNSREGTSAGDHLSEREYVPIDCLARKSLALQESNPWTDAQSSLILFKKDDILFGAMRSYFHKVTIAPFDGVTRSTCFVLRPKFPEVYSYAVLTANREETVAYASAHSRGATIPYAVWDGSLAEMKILLPPTVLLKNFDSTISPMLKLIRSSFLTQT